jgi:hypothetical protein
MLVKSLPLSWIRLKFILFKKMLLRENAKLAIFEIRLDDLKSTGASLEEAEMIINEALNIAHVEKVVLLDGDDENKLLKYKEIYCE